MSKNGIDYDGVDLASVVGRGLTRESEVKTENFGSIYFNTG